MSSLPKTERLSYLWAILAVAVAFAIRALLLPIIGAEYAFVLFVPAVAIAAWSGGFGPGLFAMLLSIGGGIYILDLRIGQAAPLDDRIGIAIFAVSSAVVVGVIEALRGKLRREIVSRPVAEAPTPVALRESERDRSLRTILDSTVDVAIVALDRNRTIREWNVGATQLTGWSRGEMIGKSADLLFSPRELENGEPALEQLLAETVGKASFSRWLNRKDGTSFLAEGTLRALPGSMGEQPGFIKVFTDVTTRAKQHEEIVDRYARRFQDGEALMYMMAHDMRQYTRGINMNCEFMLRDFKDEVPEEMAPYLTRLQANAKRMHDMVEGILKLLSVGTLPMSSKPINLSHLAEEAAARSRDIDRNAEMRFIVQPGLWVKGDKDLLSFMLGNLFENAVKYAPGKVVFGHDAAKDAFYVKDDGPGFEREYAGRIFRVFERLHGQEKPGTGIGLANAKRIVERHGGNMWAESELGQGATFYFTLKTGADEPVGSLR